MMGDVRGLGLMWGLELVQDTAPKQPFDSGLHLALCLADEAMRRGLIVYPGDGSVGGIAGDHLMLAPPSRLTKSKCGKSWKFLGKCWYKAVVNKSPAI